MKILTFKKNSWHFLLATKVAGYNAPYSYEGEDTVYGDNADICTYSRYVMRGLLGLILSGAAIAGVGFILSHIVLGIWFTILLGKFFFSEIGFVGLVCLVLWIVALIIVRINDYRRNLVMSTEYRNRPDGFIKHAYKSWKERYCLKINFKDENE